MILTTLAAAAICVPGAIDRSPLETVQAFSSAFDARDIAGVSRVFAAEVVVRDGGTELDGETVLRNYAAIIFKANPPYVATVLERITVGDLVAESAAFTGGGQGQVYTMTVFRVVGGCIVEMNSNLSVPQ